MCLSNLLEMKNALRLVFSDLFRLLIPSLCMGCQEELSTRHSSLCIGCEMHLPQTYHENRINLTLALSEHLIPTIQAAFSLYLFEENGVIEKMLYQLKYKGNRAIARYFGQKLSGFIHEKNMIFDGIIGVPLHRKRLRQRGYNQVDVIGKKLGEIFGIPYLENHIERIKNTPPLSQIKTNRKPLLVDAFRCSARTQLPRGHYLLLDDIYTTGSTLSACAEVLLEKENITLTIATIALRI